MTENKFEWSVLPTNWCRVILGDIGSIASGGTPSTKDDSNFGGDIPWITPADLSKFNGKFISKGERFISKKGLNGSSAVLLPAGTVMFSSRAPIGYAAIAANPVATNQGFKNLTLHNGIFNEYIFYYLKANKRLAESYASGTTFLEISGSKFGQLPIPIAPLAEQHRIVAKIEELFTKLDAGVTALKAAKAQIKRYRQSVLKAAVEGELTKQWREQHNDELEPASVLLERILHERGAKWEAEQLAKMEAQGKPPKDDKWKVNYDVPATPNSEDLPDLPEGWIWTTPETLSTFDSNSICAGPFGTIFKAKDFRPSGIPIIFLRHVSPGRYLTHKPGFMDVEVWRNLFQSYSVYGGELLVTKLGEPPGVCAIYPNGIGPAMVTPDVIKMSVNETATIPRFLMNYFNSEIARRYTFGIAFGTTRLRMTIPIFREMPVPLPPFAEQQQIVLEVERRLSVADEIENSLDAELKRAERLRQSILKRAFEGKLVPQDPNDEPASILLERIKVEKEQREAETRPRRNGKRSKDDDKQMELI